MAYGDIVTIAGSQYKNITPNMTGYDTPEPYHVSCNKDKLYPNGCGPAYQAFSDPPSSSTAWCWGPSGGSDWIMFDFAEPTEVDIIAYAYDHRQKSLKNILGSMDGQNFILLTGTLGNGVAPGFDYDADLVKYSFKPENSLKYRFYRFEFEGNTWGIHFFRFYVLSNQGKYLIKDSFGYKTIIENSLHEVEKDNIATVGFTDLQLIKEVSSQIGNPYSLLRYNTQNANTAIQISHMPEPQLAVCREETDISAFSSIKQFSLTATGAAGSVRVVFSFDRGKTWNTFIEGAWKGITLSIDSVQADGITPEALSAVPSEKWNEMNTGTLRIACCLSKAAVTDDMAVDVLTITGDTASWKKAKRSEDYNCMLLQSTTMTVQLLTDGSYKINYMEVKQ